MEKKKILVVGLIGLLMLLGLVIAGCTTEADMCKGKCWVHPDMRTDTTCEDPVAGDYAKCKDTCNAVYASHHPYLYSSRV